MSVKILDRLLGGLALRVLRPVRALQDLWGGYRTLRAVREIAVVKFWGIGNATLMLPVLHALKRRYPGARLTVVTLSMNAPLFRDVADRVIPVRMKPAAGAFLDLARAVATLRRLRIDLALDFEQYVRASQVLLYLAGARQVLAFDTAGQRRAELADVKVPYDDTRHTGETYLALGQAAGISERAYRPGGLTVPDVAPLELPADRPLVVLHPGSGDNFPGRRWPTRRFGLLARRLVDAGATVAVTGTRRESDLVREVVEASERELLPLAGTLSLDAFVALLARARVVVANDSGPVHIAGALGVPVLGLYGPNTPRLYGPLSAGSVAFYDAPACSPCITNFNYKTSRCCNPVCIRAIELDDVARAALRLVAADRAERRA